MIIYSFGSGDGCCNINGEYIPNLYSMSRYNGTGNHDDGNGCGSGNAKSNLKGGGSGNGNGVGAGSIGGNGGLLYYIFNGEGNAY